MTEELTIVESDPKRQLFEDIIKIIARQSDIDDLLLTEKTYYECNCDVSKTILRLLNISIPRQKHEKDVDQITILDDIREIMDEKDQIFYNRFNKN